MLRKWEKNSEFANLQKYFEKSVQNYFLTFGLGY